MLSRTFNIDLRAFVITLEQFKKVVSDIPADWNKRSDLRRYIAFIREPATVPDVISQIELKEGVDSIKAGKGVVYMSTLLSGLTKSRFTRLITKKFYQDITIRNYTTVQKLLALTESSL